MNISPDDNLLLSVVCLEPKPNELEHINDLLPQVLRKHALTMNWEAFTDRCKLHACDELVYSYLLLTAEFYNVELPTEITSKYSHLVTPDNRERFIHYLHCEYVQTYHVGTHWQNIRGIKSTGKQLRYFLELIFPPKAFMIQKYDPQPLKGSKD
jgi:hypothetical protein